MTRRGCGSSGFAIVRVASHLALAGAAALSPAGARAQFPAELAGRVIEAGSSVPIDGALVEIDASAHVLTDASGSFTLRSADAGAVVVRVSRTGYSAVERRAVLESGRTTTIVVAMDPAPIEIEALEVVAQRASSAGYVFTREAIESSGARTLGELVRAVPGVVVRADAGGRGERASIRGSGADAVLVLLDGAPLNDPMSGEADLALVSLDDVASVRVVAGAQTARFGPRAEAGVIAVESRGATAGAEAAALRGSQGERALSASAGARLGSTVLRIGGHHTELEDAFSYERPATLGGGAATRHNADERSLGVFGALNLDLLGAPLRLRLDASDAHRGLPGPMHALTPEARHDVRRTSIAGGWRLSGRRVALRVDANASWQRARFEDPEPAFGPAYFDTTEVREAGVRLEADHAWGTALERSVALGAELRVMRLSSSALQPGRVARDQPGLFARARLEASRLAQRPAIDVALRADRWTGDWISSHDVTLSAALGPVALTASHRSAFSPPAASDQFFRSGFAIAPNPDLEPERVPSEVELGASAALEIGAVPVQLGLSAFHGDVDGMIVWLPDFRFVWSPRNRDVQRSGGDVWLRAQPVASIEANGWASFARVTWAGSGDGDDAQIVYRPRVSGGAGFTWRPGRWRVSLDALHTGVRQATPGGANPLPAYWEIDGALAREWHLSTLQLTTTLAVDRVLDNRDPFVHGYPEAGRRLRLELRAAPTGITATHNGMNR